MGANDNAEDADDPFAPSVSLDKTLRGEVVFSSPEQPDGWVAYVIVQLEPDVWALYDREKERVVQVFSDEKPLEHDDPAVLAAAQLMATVAAAEEIAAAEEEEDEAPPAVVR